MKLLEMFNEDIYNNCKPRINIDPWGDCYTTYAYARTEQKPEKLNLSSCNR